MRRIQQLAGVAAVLAMVACTPKESNLGSIHGRVVASGGAPVRGARVALDAAGGRSVMTNLQGEFRLSAKPGSHDLFALHSATQTAAVANINLAAGNVEVGDVVLEDCNGLPTPEEGGGSEPGNSGDGTDPAPPPCEWEEPPPPSAEVHIDVFEADYVDAFADSWGLYGFADSMDQSAFLDFSIQGDFSAGGSFTGSVENDYTTWDVAQHVGLFTWDEATGYGYYYVLRSGDLTVNVEDADGDGTMEFSFKGENLILDYMGWDGTANTDYTATIGLVELEGDVWTWEEPEPPTEDVIIDTFVADWVDIMLLEECAPDGGDLLFIYAFDDSAVADLHLGISVNDLALPGDSDLLGWIVGGTTDGFASYYGDNASGGWFYDLNHITVSTDAAGIAVGDELTLGVSDGVFDYWGGGIIVEPGDPSDPNGGGGTTGSGNGTTDPPETDFHLFINSGELTGIVNDGYGDGPNVPLEG